MDAARHIGDWLKDVDGQRVLVNDFRRVRLSR